MYSKSATNDNQRSLGQRLRVEMKKRGLSSVELARRADVKTSFLYDVISGKSANPSSIKLARVAESLGVSLTYLAGTSDSPVEGYHFSLPDDGQNMVALPRFAVERGALVVRQEQDEVFQFHVKWLRQIAGADHGKLRLITVSDSSMAPSFLPGDVLIIDGSKQYPSPPGVFLLFDGHGLSVKRLEMVPHDGRAVLRVLCDNPQYSSFDTALESVQIVGRAVWLSRNI